MTRDLSDRLKYGHTLKAKIEKFGLEEGIRIHEESLRRNSFGKTLQGYIERLGEEDGRRAWESRRKSIGEASRRAWSNPTLKMRERGTLQGYQKKYGEEEGLRRWLHKCNTHSERLRKIPKASRKLFEKYRNAVIRVTEANVKLFHPEWNELRGFENHLDHKFSVVEGFNRRLHPYLMGFVENLTVLTRSENCSKQSRCSISVEDLIQKYRESPVYLKMVEGDFLNLRGSHYDFLENFPLTVNEAHRKIHST